MSEEKKVINTAEIVHALKTIEGYAQSTECHTEDAHVLGYLNQIRAWVKSALSAPPRNCDVGTALEQTERFKQLCRKYRRGPGPRTNCKGCPISRESQHVGCTFAWAQMPYAKEGV